MNVGLLQDFSLRDKLPPFVKYNVERIKRINCLRRTTVPMTTQIKSLYEILVEQFKHEIPIRKDSPGHPKAIVRSFSISPDTYFPALVEALASEFRWNSLIEHDLFSSKKLIKTVTAVPFNVAEEMLVSYKAPEAFITEVQKFK